MAGARLDAEWVRAWCERVEPELARYLCSFEARYGYPPGRNVVARATPEGHRARGELVELTRIPPDLSTVYRVIDEVCLPDVDIGFFFHSASTVADHFRSYEPVHIDGEEPAVVFGSDGGGLLYALAGSGRVWRSTTASWSGRFAPAGAGLRELFEGLILQIAGRL